MQITAECNSLVILTAFQTINNFVYCYSLKSKQRFQFLKLTAWKIRSLLLTKIILFLSKNMGELCQDNAQCWLLVKKMFHWMKARVQYFKENSI